VCVCVCVCVCEATVKAVYNSSYSLPATRAGMARWLAEW